jgi:hypothetical protein
MMKLQSGSLRAAEPVVGVESKREERRTERKSNPSGRAGATWSSRTVLCDTEQVTSPLCSPSPHRWRN